ncbi:DUF3108 domain-containing protein [Neptunomonas antarctica]|uniref:DUF3108 domain-containing protein n=1 Tax=Neptunomonas antarctica TaxID=619304 RepID=A0A1N7LQ86_9GAMM|nr:DUF3108 domain-containing protein [Neptunomonas antarctica]SIS76006.1 Protein of unknown function [Neptunomonas antarctica]
MQTLLKGLLSAALLISMPAYADSSPPVQPFKATYTSEWDAGIALTGEVERSLSSTPEGQWIFRTYASAMIASIDEKSTVTFNQSDVIPQQYYYQKTVLGKKREAKLAFDWPNMSVNNDIDKKPWNMAIPTATQDKLSYQLQMRLDLKTGKKGPLSYKIADGGRLKEYNFNIIGNETIQSPLGEYDTIKVEMDRGPNASRETYIWYAPALDYMIVKLKQIEGDGTVYALQLKSMKTF